MVLYPKPLLVAFLLALCLAPGAAAVSSEQAKGAAAYYLLSGEVAVVGAHNPIEIGGDRFWLIYFAPQDAKDAKNLVVVVKDDGTTATVETRQSVLEEVYAIDFNLDLLALLNGRQISFTTLDSRVQEVTVKARSNARVGLDRILAQQSNYPDLTFDSLDKALTDVEDRAQLASETISDGKQYETSFAQTLLPEDLKLALDQYNASLQQIQYLSQSVDDYHSALDSKQNEISKSKLPSEIADSLSKSLDSIRDVGMDASFVKSLEPGRRSYESYVARKVSQVNDSMSSFFFRKAKVEAQAAYSAAQTRETSPDALLSASVKADLASCGLSTKTLQSKWLTVKAAMVSSSTTLEGYAAIPAQVSEVNALTDSIAEKLRTCLNGAPATPKPSTAPAGNDNLKTMTYLIVAAIVGYLAYRYYQKQKEQAQESENA